MSFHPKRGDKSRMSAELISGTRIAEDIRQELAGRIGQLKAKGVTPGLVMVRVGEDPASVSYVSGKSKTSAELGIYSETLVYPDNASEKELLSRIAELNSNLRFHGILVQLPLPKHIDEDKVLNAIDPLKDVDGFHPVNVGRMLIGEPYFLPCTPHGVQELLMRSANSPEGKHVVICGRSNLVGKPLMAILVQKKAGFVAQLEKVMAEGRLFFSQPVTPAVIEYVRQDPEIGGGVRQGNVIYESKIPYMTRDFLAENDPTRKRYLYCHCPWAREAILTGEPVNEHFCNCSAGFHKRNWEVIFEQPLKAEVLESVLRGDERCRFAIHLPLD